MHEVKLSGNKNNLTVEFADMVNASVFFTIEPISERNVLSFVLSFAASRETPSKIINSTIVIEFVAHMYKDATFVGQNYWIGAAFEIGTTQIWAGQLQITGAAAVDPTGMVCN